MTNNCEFHVLLLIFWNMKFVTGYVWKQISWSNLTLQTIASYNMSSVVLVFSMLSLGRILISNLVVANLLMYTVPGMILLYLATLFLHWRYFWMRFCKDEYSIVRTDEYFARMSILLHFCKDEYSIVTQIKHK